MKVNPDSIKKILFITLSNIGDAILTTPSLDLLRRFFPKAEITVMVGPRSQEVFVDHPHVQHLILYDKHARFREKLALMMRLRSEKFDLVIDLRHTAIPLLIQPRYSTSLIRKRSKKHAVLEHLERLKSLGIKGHFNFTLPDRKIDKEFVDQLLKKYEISSDDAFIVIAPGAASRLKRWGLEKFKILGDHLRKNLNRKIIIVGPPSDESEFGEMFPSAQWVNLVGKLSLMQLGALLKKSCLFITNDSGPMHMAVALGTPVLALFGPTDPKIYGPIGPQHRVVRLELPCSPCMARECLIKTHDCLKNLEVEKVLNAAREMLMVHPPS